MRIYSVHFEGNEVRLQEFQPDVQSEAAAPEVTQATNVDADKDQVHDFQEAVLVSIHDAYIGRALDKVRDLIVEINTKIAKFVASVSSSNGPEEHSNPDHEFISLPCPPFRHQIISRFLQSIEGQVEQSINGEDDIYIDLAFLQKYPPLFRQIVMNEVEKTLQKLQNLFDANAHAQLLRRRTLNAKKIDLNNALQHARDNCSIASGKIEDLTIQLKDADARRKKVIQGSLEQEKDRLEKFKKREKKALEDLDAVNKESMSLSVDTECKGIARELLSVIRVTNETMSQTIADEAMATLSPDDVIAVREELTIELKKALEIEEALAVFLSPDIEDQFSLIEERGIRHPQKIIHSILSRRDVARSLISVLRKTNIKKFLQFYFSKLNYDEWFPIEDTAVLHRTVDEIISTAKLLYEYAINDASLPYRVLSDKERTILLHASLKLFGTLGALIYTRRDDFPPEYTSS